MKIHLLSGFLGSGKTTAIEQAVRILLPQQVNIGVITNDQGIKLVDTGFLESLDIPVRQVVNGCFCCNYNELEMSIESLLESVNPEMIFAESVGSCTDIIATVMKPLMRDRKNIEVTFSVFADARLLYLLLNGRQDLFEKEVNYIYYKQLEEAAILVINKIDLVSSEQVKWLRAYITSKYGEKKLLFQNSLCADSLQPWLDTLRGGCSGEPLSSLEVDYDSYGVGEAKLAWLDLEISIHQTTYSAAQDAMWLINTIYNSITEKNYPLGHLKFLLNKKYKISFTLGSTPEAKIDLKDEPPAFASLLINARVQTEPSMLYELVSNAIKHAEERRGCSILVNSVSSFRPGYPSPTHRLS